MKRKNPHIGSTLKSWLREEGIATDSCGCVFCDIGIKPTKHDGKMMHSVSVVHEWVPCTRKGKKK